MVVLTNVNSARPNQFAQVVAELVNPVLAPPKMVAIEDKQPELAVRLGALLDQIAAGKDVKDQLTPERAALLTPEATSFFIRTVKLIWPSESQSLVSRTERSGVTVSTYRIRKNKETRIVTFGLAQDGKVAVFGIQPDPDVR